MTKPTTPKLYAPKKILIPQMVRCSECNRKYQTLDRFPEVKFNFEMPQRVSEEDREDVLKNLAIAISSFAEYVYLKYQLDAASIEMSIDFDSVPKSEVSEA
jgi:hypothetical protein